MINVCGSQRSEKKGQLPVYAWRLDNTLPIQDDEILLDLTKIHLENGSFNQIYNECSGSEEKMIENIKTIVSLRSKLHNPCTGTGGLLCGKVKEIGKKAHAKGIKVGDEVLVPVSSSLIPIHIDEITDIDFVYGHINVKGYGIAFDGCTMIKISGDASWDTLLCCFEESASIHRTMELAKDKENILVIGSNPVIMCLYGIAMKDAIKKSGKVVGIVVEDTLSSSFECGDQKRNKALSSIFDELYFALGQSETDVVKEVTLDQERLFDCVINCADQPGAEAISVLSTKPMGKVFFSNLTNNYTIAIFIQEGIARPMELECAIGYVEGYDQIMLDFLSKHREEIRYIEKKLNETKNLKKKAFSHEEKKTPEQLVIANAFHSTSQVMEKLSLDIEKAAKFDCNVVITGESGVGKEIMANTLYKLSERNGGPLIKVNCAAIPKELMESEFFGYEKGAFTGAKASGKVGYFEMADKGILFLDEICDMPLDMQAKLLRVVQEGEFYRVGGSQPIHVNTRFIAATNKPIKDMIDKKLFREDLYYRLAVVELNAPSLNSRKEDIPNLVQYFLEKYNKKFGSSREISEEAIEMLCNHDWPGNVRELENYVQKLIVLSYGEEGNTITMGTVLKVEEEKGEKPAGVTKDQGTFGEKVERLEKTLIKEALERCGSTYKAAADLGMTQSQLMRKKKKYNL